MTAKTSLIGKTAVTVNIFKAACSSFIESPDALSGWGWEEVLETGAEKHGFTCKLYLYITLYFMYFTVFVFQT